VATVVPLSLLQLPNPMESGLPATVIARLAGHDSTADLVRAAGLALPMMACAAPVAAVLARRHRAWPALLTGLIVIGAADLLGNSVHSVLGIALDQGLHGLGAGTALAASLAVTLEHKRRWRRLLSRWWAAVAVLSLLGSVPLMRGQLAGGDWRTALQPFPWLTAAALAATALYIAVTGGSGPQPRSAVTPAERTQLGLLAVPLAGLGALDLGVSGQSSTSVTAAGVAVFILAGLVLVTSTDAVTGGERGRLCFPLIGACAGFTLAPTAGVIAAPRLLALPLAAAAVACAAGTGIAWLSSRGATAAGDDKPVTGGGSAAAARDGQRRGSATGNGRPGSHAAPHKSTRKRAAPRPGSNATARPGGNAAAHCVLAGLTCAAAGLAVARTAWPAATAHEQAATAAYALLGGGVTMALSAGITEATPAGAMSGLSLTLAGSLTGYLVAGVIQIRLVGSLARAVGWWEGAAAIAVLATASGVFLLGRARRDQEEVAARG
jgi:hypothetical protein